MKHLGCGGEVLTHAVDWPPQPGTGDLTLKTTCNRCHRTIVWPYDHRVSRDTQPGTSYFAFWGEEGGGIAPESVDL